MSCPECGARAVEGMEGNAYLSHFSSCPRRRTFDPDPPRPTLRHRGGEIIVDARRKFSSVDWWLVLVVALLVFTALVAMDLLFNWLESQQHGR